MNNSRLILIIGVAALVAIVLWYFLSPKTEVKTAEEALEAISEAPAVNIETNPVKKVPSLNPVEKVNPFKTTNPFE